MQFNVVGSIWKNVCLCERTSAAYRQHQFINNEQINEITIFQRILKSRKNNNYNEKINKK